MTQTIAMQRGTASGTANGNASTIFTNTSSGSGTRVICNMLTVSYTGPYTSTQGANGTGQIMIIHQSSGGTSHIIGRYSYGYTQNGAQNENFANFGNYAMQFNIIPNGGNAPQQNLFVAGQNNSNATGYITAVPIYPTYNTGGSQSILPSGANIQSLANCEPTWYNGSTFKLYNFMPQNFWMGPSDSLLIKTYMYGYYYSGKSQVFGYQNHSVGYSFTTITES